MIPIRLLLLPVLLIYGLVASARPVAAAGPLDWTLPVGHFFTETGGAPNVGFMVSNQDGVPFLDELNRRGGAPALGYPVSRRFQWKGFTVQAFQKAVLQWQSDGKVYYLNVFDDLAQAGRDDWLRTVRSTPSQVWLDGEGKLSWDQIVKGRLAFLDANAAIKTRYFATADPLTLYGLPASRVEDMGNHYAIRLQRAVIQQWKVDVPWARAGETTVANGGDILKESGLLPADALGPLYPDGTNAAITLPTTPITPTAAPAPTPGATPGGPGAAPTPAGGNAATPTPTPPPLPATPPVFRDAPIKQIPAPGEARRIVLDPGHGGGQVGASARIDLGRRLLEKDVNLDIARRAAALLRTAGYQVTLTRDADIQLATTKLADDLQARIDLANGGKADVFVSIHHNGIGNPDIRGIEAYYATDRPFSEDSKVLATLLYNQIGRQMAASGYDAYPRGAKTDSMAVGAGDHFFVLSPPSKIVKRAANMPGALVEALFLTNDRDAAQLGRTEIREAIARGYAVGVGTFLTGRRAASPTPAPAVRA